MNYELFIRSSSQEIDFALLKDGKLIELNREDEDGNKFAVGDIYLAKIRRIVPGLNAAFVNVGHEKDAFLHYHDLGPNVPTLLDRKSTRLNSSHVAISYAVFCLKKKKHKKIQ